MLPAVPNMAGSCANAYFATDSSNTPVVNFGSATAAVTCTMQSPITFMQSMPVSGAASTMSMSACPNGVAVARVPSSVSLGGVCGGGNGVLANQMLSSCSASTAPTFMPQQSPQPMSTVPQQPLVFSGPTGNFFLAQPTPGSLGTTVMIAPPNHANPSVSGPNTFVAALAPSGPNAGSVNAPPAGCFIRFPDGRLMMSPTMGLHRSAAAPISQLPPACVVTQSSTTPSQPAFFPLAMPVVSGSNPTMASNVPLPGQMPAGAVNFPGGGTVLSPCPTPVSNNFQSQTQTTVGNTLLKSSPNVLLPSICQQTGSSLLTTPLGAGRTNSAPVDNSTDLVSLVSQHGGLAMQQQQQPLPTVVSQHQQIYPQSARPLLVPVSTNSFVDSTVINTNIGIPQGLPVTRLPHGAVAAIPFGQNSTLPVAANASPSVRPRTPAKSSLGTRQCHSFVSPAPPPPASAIEVMRRMDEQIAHLQAISCPTESQASRLRQLILVRNQLMKAPVESSRITNTTLVGSIPAVAQQANHTSYSPTNSRRTNKALPISTSLRRELMDTLQRHNLSPRNIASSENTFVVEFRLNQQRYQLRLTRSQKSDMEQLLYTCDSKRQAEILTVFQQEQARVTGRGPRMLLPQHTVTTSAAVTAMSTSVSPSVQPSFQMPSQVNSSIMAQATAGAFGAPTIPLHQSGGTTFSASPGLRLLAARPLLSTNTLVRQSTSNISAPGTPISVNSSTTLVGLVTAVPMPLMAAPGTNGSFISSNVTAPASGVLGLQGCSSAPTGLFPLPISSFAPSGQPQTFVMHTASSIASAHSQAPLLLPSCSVSTPILPPGCSLLQAPVSQQSNFDSLSLSATGTTSVMAVSVTAAAPHNSLLLTSGGQPVSMPTPPIITMMTVQQAARLARMRAHLSNDIRLSVDKHPSGSSDVQQLQQHQLGDCDPSPSQLLSSVDLLQALAPYHVLRDAENTEQALEKVDKILSDSLTILTKRKRQTVGAITALLFKESLHPLETSLEDRMLTSYMAFDLERDLLKSEKLAFMDALQLASADCESVTAKTDQLVPASVQISTEDSCCIGKAMLTASHNSNADRQQDWFGDSVFPDSQSPAAQRRAKTAYHASASYFKQTESCLSPPWNTLLGSLGSLRPLTVDSSGNAVPTIVEMPTLELSAVNGASPAKAACYDSTLVGESGDLARIVGKGNAGGGEENCLANARSTTSKVPDESEGMVNGLLQSPSSPTSAASPFFANQMRVETDDISDSANLSLGHNASIIADPWREDYVPFVEETFDIWKEIIKEQGMDMETIEQDDGLDRELDSMMPNDCESMRSLDNGLSHPVSEIQHSEDPDIDAAIRSILSSSD